MLRWLPLKQEHSNEMCCEAVCVCACVRVCVPARAHVCVLSVCLCFACVSVFCVRVCVCLYMCACVRAFQNRFHICLAAVTAEGPSGKIRRKKRHLGQETTSIKIPNRPLEENKQFFKYKRPHN